MARAGLRFLAVLFCAFFGASTAMAAFGPTPAASSNSTSCETGNHVKKAKAKKAKAARKAGTAKKTRSAKKSKAAVKKASLKKRSAAKRKARIAQRNAAARAARLASADDFMTKDGQPRLYSNAALVIDQESGVVLYEKNPDSQLPIASITKVMTAMVILDANLPMDELITIGNEDVDRLKYSSSRLRVGTVQSRRELIHLALMASENRASAALARTYPGGTRAFVAAMNRKALSLGMTHTRFLDATGLNSGNVASPRDVARMIHAAYNYDFIRLASTSASHIVGVGSNGSPLEFRNTNALVRSASNGWNIGLSKTGFINEAGHCLAMQAKVAERPLIIVLLDSQGTYGRIGDANRIRRWLEHTKSI